MCTRQTVKQATCGFGPLGGRLTVQVSALTFSYCCSPALTFSYCNCCSPIPFEFCCAVVSVGCCVEQEQQKKVERSPSLITGNQRESTPSQRAHRTTGHSRGQRSRPRATTHERWLVGVRGARPRGARVHGMLDPTATANTLANRELRAGVCACAAVRAVWCGDVICSSAPHAEPQFRTQDCASRLYARTQAMQKSVLAGRASTRA